MRPFVWVNILAGLAGLGLLWLAVSGALPGWWLLLLLLLHLGITTVGVMRMRWNYFYPHLHRGARSQKHIALTFDDGPVGLSAAVLDILAAEGAPATFFVIGDRAVERPELLRRMAAEGHLIGNHSQHHGTGFDWKRPAGMLAEMEEANKTIERIAGVKPLLFRPPYGITNPALAKAIRRSGMHSIGWSLRSYDTNYRDGEALLKRVLKNLRSGDVLLMHDRLPLTAGILTGLIRAARERGFTFVPLHQLLGIDAYL